MDVELRIVNLHDNPDMLRNYVESLSLSFIEEELPKVVLMNDGAIIIQTLLSGLNSQTGTTEKKLQVTETILREIEDKQIPPDFGEKLINVLAAEVDDFSTTHLLRLVEVCCNMLKNPNYENSFNCWKELLPRLLQLLVKIPELEHHGTQMSGDEYTRGIITAICVASWPEAIIIDIASMFNDMPLNKEERSRIVRKLCHRLNALPSNIIPKLSLQLLRLTRNEESITFFLALADYFNVNLYSKMDRNAPSFNAEINNLKEISAIEGAVLSHMMTNLGPNGLKDLIKTLRLCLHAPEFILQPFLVTMILAVSSVSSAWKDDLLGLLKSALFRAALEEDCLVESSWLQSVWPPQMDIKILMNRVLENCFRGRDTVLKGLINLGFTLLGVSRSKGKEVSTEKLHSLGVCILEDLVKRHRLVTSTILQTLGNYICQSKEAGQYIDCLIVLARKQPLNVLDCNSVLLKLQTDMCNRLPGPTASLVLTALLPLCRLSQTVRDNMVTSLRSALFPNDIERRIMAVKGFLELLRDLKISNIQTLSQSMSQNYCKFTQLCSQSLTGGASQSNEGLCLEVLTILRQVFKQQCKVKTVLYRGIYAAVKVNPELGEHVLGYLQTHVNKYCSSEDSPTPFNFHDAVVFSGTDTVLLEPLGEMILCLALLATKLDDYSHSVKLQEKLDSFCQRMATCTVSDFHLESDSGANILDPSPEGQKLLEVACQVLGVYEALMGYLLCAWNKRSDSCAGLFWNLFKGFTCLSDYAKGLGKGEKKKGGKPKDKSVKSVIFKMPSTALNLKCIARLLVVINNVPVNWATEDNTSLLRGKRELHRYAISATSSLLAVLKDMPPAELSRDCISLGYLCKIGRILYTKMMLRLMDTRVFDLQTTVMGVQCFIDLLALIYSHFNPKFLHFLGEIVGVTVSSQGESPVQSVLSGLLEQLDDVIAEDETDDDGKEDLQAKKMSLLFLSLFPTLIRHLPSGSPFTNTVLGKIEEVCLNRSIEKPTLAKTLLSLLLSLHRRCKESSNIQLDISFCLCDCLSLIDDEIELDEHRSLKIVNIRTGNVCLVAICEALQQQLAEVDWTVNKLKAESECLLLPSDEPLESRKENLRERERELCRHVNKIVKVLSVLCVISVPPGIYSDALLKTLEIMYSKLALITKYISTKISKFNESLEATRFDKTVRLVDSELTKNMYCFTDHVISDGTGDSGGANPSLLKQRALKETKLIPKVILEKEQFQKYLLQLSKKAKVDLASRTKHTLARDYRLYTKQVRTLLEKENGDPETDLMEVEEYEEEIAEEPTSPSGSPSSKRSRSSQVTSSP